MKEEVDRRDDLTKHTSTIETRIDRILFRWCKIVDWWIVNHWTRSNTVSDHYYSNDANKECKIFQLWNRKSEHSSREQNKWHYRSDTIYAIATSCGPRDRNTIRNDKEPSHHNSISIAIMILDRSDMEWQWVTFVQQTWQQQSHFLCLYW